MTTEKVTVEKQSKQDFSPSCIEVMMDQKGGMLKAFLPRRLHEPTDPLFLLIEMILVMFVSCVESRSSTNCMPQYVVKRQEREQT